MTNNRKEENAMSEEKIKILDMLKDGKITTDEAMALLKQVEDDSDRPPRHHWQDWEFRTPHYSYRPDFSWINDLRSTIEETSRNVLFPDELLFNARQEKFTTGTNIRGDILTLAFEGKNAPVKLESYGGDRIEAEVYYKTRNQWNPRFTLSEDNGVYSLDYDDNALYMLGINIRVPETAQISNVRLKNRNAPITVNDITADKIELNTKNEAIKVSGIKGEYLYCETRNASIALDAVETREIDAQTSSSRILLKDVDAFRARLVTSSAKIEVKGSGITQLYAKTSNSPLRFDSLSCKEHGSICSIDAITTNGQISIHLPQRELNCKLRASTTIGRISSELNDLEYQVNEMNYVEAQTRGYETAQNKLNLNLQTTNHGIYIER